MIRWILLDIDDTLIDYTSAHQTAFQQLLKRVQELTQLPLDLLEESYYIIKKRLYQRFHNQYPRHDKLLQIKLFCNHLNIYSIQTIQELCEEYESVYLKEVQCFEGTIPFLEECRSKGLEVILMTNNLLPIQMKVFEKMGFEKYVKTMLTSHEFTYEKPHPESLLYIMDKFKIRPEEAIVIGDSQSDLAWGQSVGIRSILCEPKKESLVELFQQFL